MTTEQYSIGYDAGYQDGFDAALAEPVKQDPVGEVVLERMGVGDAQIVRFQMYGKIPPVGTKLYPAPISAEAAVLSEREACAEVCDRFAENEAGFVAEDCAAEIRARDEK